MSERSASGGRLTRAERAERNRALWAAAAAQAEREVDAASPPLGADKQTKRAARQARRRAWARRDAAWRAEASQPAPPAATTASSPTASPTASPLASGSGSGASPVPRPRRRSSPARRQIEATEAGVTAAWQAQRPPSRAELRVANRERWAQLQIAKLAATQEVRTGRRGERRRARSRAWLAKQTARLEQALGNDQQSRRGGRTS